MGLGTTLRNLAGVAAPIAGYIYGGPAGGMLGSAVGQAITSYGAGQDIAQAQNKAAELKAKAAADALAFQKEQYANIQPYLMSSLSGYQDLLQNPQSVTQTPGYLFRLNEGLKAVGIPEGSKPGNLSGAQIKAGIQYAQNYATNEYTNALARMAGLGQLAQGAYNVGSTYAANAGKLTMTGAEATAGGVTGAAQARTAGNIGVGNAIGQGLYQYGMYNLLNNQKSGGVTVPSSPITNPGSYYGSGYVPPGGSFNTPNYGYNTALGAEGTGFATY